MFQHSHLIQFAASILGAIVASSILVSAAVGPVVSLI